MSNDDRDKLLRFLSIGVRGDIEKENEDDWLKATVRLPPKKLREDRLERNTSSNANSTERF
jgi:hypothetical protein